jgi:hypothetical protein
MKKAIITLSRATGGRLRAEVEIQRALPKTSLVDNRRRR